MRRSFNKMAMLSAVLAATGGIDPSTGEQRAAPKARFVAGDHFYNGLRYKRVNGKWKVKK